VAGTVGGYLFGYFNGNAERSHGERLARAARLHEQRLEVYTEAATMLEREIEFLYLGEPMPSLYPRPVSTRDPPQRPKADWANIQGRLRIVGSEAVYKAVSSANTAVRLFELQIADYREVLASQVSALLAATSDEERERIRGTPPEGFRAAADRANELRLNGETAIEKAQLLMREELAGL
jgi:hypothetical protein